MNVLPAMATSGWALLITVLIFGSSLNEEDCLLLGVIAFVAVLVMILFS